MADDKDFVSFFGAPTNGTSGCSAQIRDVGEYCLTHDDVRITVPPFTYMVDGTVCLGEMGEGFTLEWYCPGATFDADAGGGHLWFGGGVDSITTNMRESNAYSARIQSVLRGSASLPLVTAGDSAIFAVGNYVYIYQEDVQPGGHPPNHAVFEYAKITDITGTTTKVLHLDRQIKNNYWSTLPLWDAGSASSIDHGGPASVLVMPPRWSGLLRLRGLAYKNGPDAQIAGPIRRLEQIGCQALHDKGCIPSVNEFFIDEDCDHSIAGLEVDKAVENFISTRTTYGRLHFQSASSSMWFIANDLVVLDRLLETPARTTINGATLTRTLPETTALRVGCTYGPNWIFKLKNATTPDLDYGGAGTNDIFANGWVANGRVLSRSTNGAGGQLEWGVKGAHLLFSQQNKFCNWLSKIVDFTQDATNIYVTLANPIPSWIGDGVAVRAYLHPGPHVEFENVTGNVHVVDFSNAEARGRPLWEYSRRSYSGSAGSGREALDDAALVILVGRPVRIDVRVSQAYTGAQSTLELECFNALRQVDHETGSQLSLSHKINLKQAGTRTYIHGVGWSGSQAGDDLDDFPTLAWFAGAQQLTVNHDVSGEASGLQPIVEIEVNLSQGVSREPDPVRLKRRKVA